MGGTIPGHDDADLPHRAPSRDPGCAPPALTRLYHRRMPDVLLVLIVILVLAILWRGPKTLPKLGEALGRGFREARTEASKAQTEVKARMDADEPAKPGTTGTSGDDKPS
jgi:Sec-independent protein translocase protein TatA